MLAPSLRLRFFAGTRQLGEMDSSPRQCKMAVKLPGRAVARAEFDSTLHGFLLPYDGQREEAERGAAAPRVRGAPQPPPDHRGPGLIPHPWGARAATLPKPRPAS